MQSPSPTAQHHRVVFQLVAGDQASQQALLSNLENLLHAWPQAEIEVVIHGPGISLVIAAENPFTERLTKLVETYMLRLVVCQHTLRGQQRSARDLLPFVDIVPVAIVELILKQEQGWAYIRSGL